MKTRTRRLVESAMMIAIASVLSVLKLIDMPYGGSVTAASMLPIVIIAYRYGIGYGMLSGLSYGVVQQLLGLKNLNYVSEWYSVLAVMVLDYLLAFTVLGLGGVMRGKCKSQAQELSFAIVIAGVMRFVCHFLSGITVWAGWGLPTGAALIYSLGYNATYMLPEIIVGAIAAYQLGRIIDFTTDQPTRISRQVNASGFNYSFAGGLVLSAGLIADIIMIFPKLQNSEDGSFFIQGLWDVKWMNVLILTVLCIVVAFIIFAMARMEAKRSLRSLIVKFAIVIAAICVLVLGTRAALLAAKTASENPDIVQEQQIDEHTSEDTSSESETSGNH